MNAQGDWVRAQAVDRARRAQEDRVPDWTELAAYYLREFGRRTALGCPFLVEDAIASAPLAIRPKEPRAWGAAVLTARRKGWLVPAKRDDGSRAYGIGRVNASPKPTWMAP